MILKYQNNLILLQEIKINYNNRYLFYFSSSINKTQSNRSSPLPKANAKIK